jgi:DNA-directed RNA polymerase specialized sigma24 family protein
MKRRALNHLRGSKHRGNLQTTALAHINERSTLWSDRRNQEAEWIHEMDKAHLMGLAKSPLETVAMNHLLNHSNLRIRDTAREHGINYNTIHAGMRRMRAKLRDYLDE